MPFGVGSTELLIKTILENGTTAISLHAILSCGSGNGNCRKNFNLSPSDLGLKLGLFGGEPGIDDPAFRKRLSDTWGCSYAMQIMVVTDVFCNFASECAYDSALHLWPMMSEC